MYLGMDTVGNLCNGLSAISVHMWIKLASLETVPLNSRMSTQIGPVQLYINSSGILRVGSTSSDGDTFETKVATTAISTGAYTSIGGVINWGADTITPYLAGTAEGGGSVTFASSTYVHTAVSDGWAASIGSNGGAGAPDSTYQTDGDIAEFAIWNTALTGGNFASLAGGAAANTVASGNLIAYMRILGTDSPETDLINGLSGTITGSLPQATHPTITSAGMLKRHRGMDGMGFSLTGGING